MPYVRVQLVEGRTDEQKKKVIEGITDVLVKEANAKRDSVWVYIDEVAPKHFGVGGQLLSDIPKK